MGGALITGRGRHRQRAVRALVHSGASESSGAGVASVGSTSSVVSFFINIWYGIPDLLVALILVFVLSDALHLIPRGVFVIIIAFALTR
jgi:hypothetical protein